MVEIYNLFQQGKIKEAAQKQLSIFGLFNVLVSSVEVQVVGILIDAKQDLGNIGVLLKGLITGC